MIVKRSCWWKCSWWITQLCCSCKCTKANKCLLQHRWKLFLKQMVLCLWLWSQAYGSRWVVELCSPEQLKGKYIGWVFFQQRKCSCSEFVLPFMSGGSLGVVEGNICEKGFQSCNVLFSSYCHFPRISSCFSDTLWPAYNTLMHLFCLRNSLLICWKCCQGVKLCICSLKSTRIREVRSAARTC